MRIDNPDTLPYFVMEAGQRVQVRFTTLEPDDEQHIAASWTGAVYFDLWLYDAHQAIMHQITRKLIAADGNTENILGLLRMGNAVSVRLTYRKLNTQSVLETAPHLHYRRAERAYHGIGKVLVARLIAESIVQGHGGALVVSPHTRAIPFYRHLGFHPYRRDQRRFSIEAVAGTRLLQSVLLGREEQ